MSEDADIKKLPIKEIQEIAAKFLLDKRPYLLSLDNLVADLKNGTVVVELRVKDGFVTDLITTEVRRQVFKLESSKTA